jgi:hypothetical protein
MDCHDTTQTCAILLMATFAELIAAEMQLS